MLTEMNTIGATTIRRSITERIVMGAGLPLLGAALLTGLNLAADWIAGLPWAPLQGPFTLLAGVPEPYAEIGAVLLGLVVGGVLAVLAAHEAVTVVVGPDATAVTWGEERRMVSRAEVSAVFVDGTELVILGAGTEEVVRSHGDLAVGPVASAFRAHGYPWRDGDPHEAEYRRWVTGLPDVPADADALLRARERALEKKNHDDTVELRTELARSGIVVRDVDHRQHWRRLPDA